MKLKKWKVRFTHLALILILLSTSSFLTACGGGDDGPSPGASAGTGTSGEENAGGNGGESNDPLASATANVEQMNSAALHDPGVMGNWVFEEFFNGGSVRAFMTITENGRFQESGDNPPTFLWATNFGKNTFFIADDFGQPWRAIATYTANNNSMSWDYEDGRHRFWKRR